MDKKYPYLLDKHTSKFIATIDTSSSTFTKFFEKPKAKKIQKSTKQTIAIEEISQKEKQIRHAIEARFRKSKMNEDYKYAKRQDRESSHSSELEQFSYLKNIYIYNLVDQNKKKKEGSKEKRTVGKFKINPLKPYICKTEGDQVDIKFRTISGDKFKESSRQQSNINNILAKYLFKTKKTTKEKKLNFSASQQGSKYQTLNSPRAERHKQRYTKRKPKQQHSRDSSNSQSSGLKSNITLNLNNKKSNKYYNASSNILKSINSTSSNRKIQQKNKLIFQKR